MNEGSNEEAISFWRWVISETYEKRELKLSKQFVNDTPIPGPSETNGMLVRHVGELKGQIADWRASFSDTDEGFHAVEYSDCYHCHIDKKDPLKKPLEHLIEDSPKTLDLLFAVALLLTVGILVYSLARRK